MVLDVEAVEAVVEPFREKDKNNVIDDQMDEVVEELLVKSAPNIGERECTKDDGLRH